MLDDKTLRDLWERATPEQKEAAYSAVAPKGNRESYATILTEMAHNANLTWGQKTDLVADKRSWDELNDSEQQFYIERFRRIARMKEFPCFDNSGLVGSKISGSYLHEMWLQTAKDDHPANKPWSDLTRNEQFKDEIYLSFIKLWQGVLVNFEQNE